MKVPECFPEADKAKILKDGCNHVSRQTRADRMTSLKGQGRRWVRGTVTGADSGL